MSKSLLRGALALLALAAAPACDDDPTGPTDLGTPGSAQDRAAMQDIVDTFDQAWTEGDAVTYAAQYGGIEDWVGPNGAVVTDPAVLTEIYTAIFTFALPNTTRRSTIRRLTFLTGTLAVLDIDTQVTGFTAPPPGVVPWQPGIIRALEKNILVKRAGEWQIVLHQQTLVAPEG